MYIRNNTAYKTTIIFATANWVPPDIKQWLTPGWDFNIDNPLGPSEVRPLAFRLSVSSSIPLSYSTFSFDWIITCIFVQNLDVNNDGKIDMRDIRIVAQAMWSYPGLPNWNPLCDFNGDEKIDMRDLRLVCRFFGVSL